MQNLDFRCTDKKLGRGKVLRESAVCQARPEARRTLDSTAPSNKIRTSVMKTPPLPPPDAYHAFLDGQQEYSKGEYGGALEAFDAAIDRGYISDEAYSLRAVCLQHLKLNREAIDDLHQALLLEPDDCNLYFLRSNSKLALGDYDGAIADLRVAIRLSRCDSGLNRVYDDLARRDGFHRIADVYERRLMHAILSKAIDEQGLASTGKRRASSGAQPKPPGRAGPIGASPKITAASPSPAPIKVPAAPEAPSDARRPLSTIFVVAYAILVAIAAWQSFRSSAKSTEISALRSALARQAETIQWQTQKLQELGALPKVGFRINPVPIRRAVPGPVH